MEKTGKTMNLGKVWTIFFSPTGTSKKIATAIASSFSGIERSSIDLTYPGTAVKRSFKADELVVIGVPVYAGRVAPLAARRLRGMEGNGAPAVLVVLYGNREYEDALIELRDIAAAASFIPVAASAFIGEHSFSDRRTPIAQGRPDQADLTAAASFGSRICKQITVLQGLSPRALLQVPGNTPYRVGMESPPVTPKVDTVACTLCGLCIAACPGGAIAMDDGLSMDVERCIFCCSCIRTCPEEAVSIGAPPLLERQQWLHESCAQRKEPELYF
jgi:ferredoxin